MSRDLMAASPYLRRMVHMAIFLLVRAIPLSLGRFLARALATVLWFCDRPGQRAVAANLASVLPSRCPQAIRRAARQTYAACAVSVVESLHMRDLAPAFAQAELIDPWRLRDRGLLRGPCIMTTVHINFEVCCGYWLLTRAIEGVSAISLSTGDPVLDDMVYQYRAGYGCCSLVLDKAPLGSLRALRQGAIVGIIGDRDYSGHGASCRFLGHSYRLPVGPAALAVQTGCPIYPALLVRRQHTAFTALLARPLIPDPSRPADAEVQRLVQELADIYGRFIRAAPAQWIAFHRLFAASSSVG